MMVRNIQRPPGNNGGSAAQCVVTVPILSVLGIKIILAAYGCGACGLK
jgi:hypothetical protein